MNPFRQYMPKEVRGKDNLCFFPSEKRRVETPLITKFNVTLKKKAGKFDIMK